MLFMLKQEMSTDNMATDMSHFPQHDNTSGNSSFCQFLSTVLSHNLARSERSNIYF